ncbi:Holliday junction resolvase RuvX [bacterium]|nr:Holliday junction resolvase RuvX [bacterium]
MGRLLALDIGEKRTGIAMSDPMKIIASPKELFEGDPASDVFVSKIKSIIESENIEKIIVGLPKNLKNVDTLSTSRAREAKELLEKNVDIPVIFWDERMTTAQSDKVLDNSGINWRKKKKIIDKMAAALILENYLRYIELNIDIK